MYRAYAISTVCHCKEPILPDDVAILIRNPDIGA